MTIAKISLNCILKKFWLLSAFSKVLFTYQISIFFNFQYRLNWLTFYSFFLDVDRYQCRRSSLPGYWNTGLVYSRVSLTSWGECVSLAFVGHSSSYDVIIKISYGVDLLFIDQLCTPSFPIGFVKIKSVIVRSVETGIECWW